MSTALPGLVSFPRPARRVRVSNYPYEPAGEGVIAAGQVDSGNTAFRTSFLRPGYVLAKRTSTGKYVAATDANADHMTAAAVTALITNPGAGAWDGNLTVRGRFGSVVVALAADNTDAAVVAKINAAFAALDPEAGAVVATVVGARVVVTTREVGAGNFLNVSHATVASGWGTILVGTSGLGADPDVLVTEQYVDTLDGSAANVDAATRDVTRVGHYDAPNLINLTAEAAAVLLRRGSILSGTPTLVG